MLAALVVSDASDVKTLVDWRVAANLTQAAALAVEAGVDVDVTHGPYPPYVLAYPHLVDAVSSGLVNVSHIDRAASNVLRQKLAAHLFEEPFGQRRPSPPSAPSRAAVDRALAREAAASGLVLLRNERSALPLRAGARAGASAGAGAAAGGRPLRVALIGPNAGCTSHDPPPSEPGMPCPAGLNMIGTHYMHVGSQPTTLAGAVGGLAGRVVVTAHEAACDAEGHMECAPDAIERAAQAAAAPGLDAVIAVVGDSLVTCEESRDRDSLELPGGQAALLDAVADAAAKASTPLILVLIHGRPITFGGVNGTRLLERFSAALSCFRCGEQGGPALWDVLLGDANPSGHLTQAWPRAVGQVGGPYAAGALLRGKSHSYGFGEFPTYVDRPSTPLFPFGFGLSYSNHTLVGPLHVATAASAGKPSSSVARVSARVCALAGPKGHAVVQLYAQDPAGGKLVRPYRRLVGFERLPVPGAAQAATSQQAEKGAPASSKAGDACAAISIEVDLMADLAYTDADLTRRVHDGTYQLFLGMHELDPAALRANMTVRNGQVQPSNTK